MSQGGSVSSRSSGRVRSYRFLGCSMQKSSDRLFLTQLPGRDSPREDSGHTINRQFPLLNDACRWEQPTRKTAKRHESANFTNCSSAVESADSILLRRLQVSRTGAWIHVAGNETARGTYRRDSEKALLQGDHICRPRSASKTLDVGRLPFDPVLDMPQSLNIRTPGHGKRPLPSALR